MLLDGWKSFPGLEPGRLDDAEFAIFEEADAANPDDPIPRTLDLNYPSVCLFPPELLLEPLSDPRDWLAPSCREPRTEAAAIRLVLVHDAWHPGHRITDRTMQRIGQGAKEWVKLFWLSGIASKTEVEAAFPAGTAAETVRCDLDRWLAQVIPAEAAAERAKGEMLIDASEAGHKSGGAVRGSEALPALKPRQSLNAKENKRSSVRGEGREKLIAALTKHHDYFGGGCGNLSPIGNNELARMAGVAASTASAFFDVEFKGHVRYRSACADPSSLVAALKLLNREFAPHHLFGAKPPGEGDLDDD